MPPANTPQGQRSPDPSSGTHGQPLPPLSYFSSPAPDLAATLVTQAEADADDENLRFLRTPVEILEGSTSTGRAGGGGGGGILPHAQQLALLESQNRRRLQMARANQTGAPNRPNYTGNAESQLRRDPQQRDRMMRVLSRLSRFNNEAARPTGSRQEERREAPSGSGQSPNRSSDASTTVQSLVSEVAEMRGFLDDLRNNPYLAPEVGNNLTRRSDRERDADAGDGARQRQPQLQSSSSILSGLQRAEREVQALERRLDATQRRMEHTERHAEDLRSMAIMHNARINASTTERMLRYIRDREQLGGSNDHEGQNHDSNLLSRWSRLSRGTGFTSSSEADTGMPDAAARSAENRTASMSRPDDTDEWMQAFRELDSHTRTGSRTHLPVSPFLENTITYLDRLRDCSTYDDALIVAIELGFANKEFFADKHDDFLMNVSNFPPPFRSSWLQPGVKFSGSQHTTIHSIPSLRSSTNNNNPLRASEQQINSVPAATARARSTSSSLEQWPVKVHLHHVDLSTMTLAGTMEAHDVPNPIPCPPAPCNPITTFLEGQILDLQTHGFLTPHPHHSGSSAAAAAAAAPAIRFPATTPAIDAANWRRLPPFVDERSDDEVARTLLSRARMQAINERFVFMRWKERCFIHQRRRGGNGGGSGGGGVGADDDKCPLSPGNRGRARQVGEGDDTDTGHGLTISGFYYVSLERATGRAVGLYWDPGTSPYQCLRLEGRQGGVGGTWVFC